jgi:hypothetical protein
MNERYFHSPAEQATLRQAIQEALGYLARRNTLGGVVVQYLGQKIGYRAMAGAALGDISYDDRSAPVLIGATAAEDWLGRWEDFDEQPDTPANAEAILSSDWLHDRLAEFQEERDAYDASEYTSEQ